MGNPRERYPARGSWRDLEPASQAPVGLEPPFQLGHAVEAGLGALPEHVLSRSLWVQELWLGSDHGFTRVMLLFSHPMWTSHASCRLGFANG